MAPIEFFNHWLLDKRTVAEVDAKYKKMLVNHRILQINHQKAVSELAFLREQLNMGAEIKSTYITQPVLGLPADHYHRTAVINIPSMNSFKRGLPVTSAEGLVGRIESLSWRTATVRLLSDPLSRVPVKTSNGQSAILIGRGPAPIKVDFINATTKEGQKLSLKEGDVVYTSGIDEVFPSGLPVARIKQDGDDLTATPLADPVKLKYVQVIIHD